MTQPQVTIVGELRSTLDQKIGRLQGAYVNSRSGASLQTLAELRRAPIESPGTDPGLWELTLGDLPEILHGRGDDPTRAELSIHAALVLYAVHQQSQPEKMHLPGVRLGEAVAQLAQARGHGGEPDEGVVRKFHRVCTAEHRNSRLQELRALMQLMRSAGTALDHAQLGIDLFLLDGAATRDQVVLRWGRDLHRNRRPAEAAAESITN